MSVRPTTKSLSIKQIRKQMKEIRLLDSSFEKIDAREITRFISKMFSLKSTQSWKKKLEVCFHIFETCEEPSKQEIYLKQVCFIHLLSQEIKRKWAEQAEIQDAIQILVQKLQSLLDLSRNNNQGKVSHNLNNNKESSNRKERASSVGAIDWIMSKFSVSKEKKIKPSPEDSNSKNKPGVVHRQNRITSAINSKEKRPAQRQNSPFPARRHLQTDICSLELFLKKKIYEPYTVFLIKFFMAKTIFLPSHKSSNQSERIWLIINIFVKLLEVTQNFNQMIRYSTIKYEPMVIFLVQILHMDIMQSYNSLTSLTLSKKNPIDSEVLALNQENTPQARLKLLREEFIKDYKIDQFKQIIDQISVINEGLCYVYFNKYIFQTLIYYNLKPPNFIKTTGPDYDLIFKLISKHEKRSRSKSHSKEEIDTPKKSQGSNKKVHTKMINPAARERDKLKLQKRQSEGTGQRRTRMPEPNSQSLQSTTNQTGDMSPIGQEVLNKFSRQITFRKFGE